MSWPFKGGVKRRAAVSPDRPYPGALSRRRIVKVGRFRRRYRRYMRRLHRLQLHQRRGASVLRRAHLPRDVLQKMGNRGREPRERDPADTYDLLERITAAILAGGALRSFSEKEDSVLIEPTVHPLRSIECAVYEGPSTIRGVSLA